MSDRVSQYILLGEDECHERLIRAYLRQIGVSDRMIQPIIASQIEQGGNIRTVLDRFPDQLRSCRRRTARTMLIVMVDADDATPEARRQEFSGGESFTDEDPLVILTPRRHGETWIASATGQVVTEEQDCKRLAGLDRKETIRQAARVIHGWARAEPAADSTCVPSLRAALPAWRRIG